jgi:PPOX class probable F420-dependent enzyme
VISPDLRDILDGTPIAHVASVLPDGSAHSVPMWIGTSGDQIVLMTGPGSVKARNLRRDPRLGVSLTRPEDPFRSVVLHGHVVRWLDGDEGWAIVDALAAKYIGSPYPRGQDRVAMVVDVDREVLR